VTMLMSAVILVNTISFSHSLYRPTSSHPIVVCLCMSLVTDKDSSDTEADSATDTEDVETFMPNFLFYCAGK
jgi:hypothetical protein